MEQLTTSTNTQRTRGAVEDHRKLKRYNVRLKVFNQETDEIIGYVEDLNTQGMNLKSQQAIPGMQDIHIYFGADENDPDDEKISLTVIKVWGAFTDTTPRVHNTGLQYIKPTDEALDAIQELMFDLEGVSITRL